MGIFDDLQSMLGTAISGRADSTSSKTGGGFTELLGPAVLGGLISAILPGKSGTGGVLRAGGGTALATLLWNKYKDRILPTTAKGAPDAQMVRVDPAASSTGLTRVEADPSLVRLIRAMVFAAKSDGQIDDNEKQAINNRLSQMGAGQEAAKIVAAAINEPLDPNLVAAGVTGPEEAMALFLASCSVIELDHFMENSYLDALAKVLGIPPEAKKDIEDAAKKAA
ncbi:DUF533 domain-containing protein [Deltaproteobacteria bacterium Smac51]|nr:DUF533 domain-containing protein [Deltaproteobacteria bacterium Smac51]